MTCQGFLELITAIQRHWNKKAEELDFIINYDIKYRMGIGGKETEEESN